MSAADEDIHAFSIAEAKPSAAASLPRLDKPATIPFELVLNIMDHAIHHAESIDSLELDWKMERDDSQALGVSLALAEANWVPFITLQRRFNGIRTLLQISRKIRSMVLGKFYVLYPLAQEEEGFFAFILINPKKDRFQIADHRAWDIVGHPRAALKPFVKRMSKIFIGNGSFFAPSNSNNIQILQSLPSLCRVDLDIGRKEDLAWGQEDGLVELKVGSGEWRIHAGLFPDLAEWAETHKSTFPIIWQPFKERGVGLLGCRIEHDPLEHDFVESREVWLNTSSDGIYMNLCENLYFYHWS